MSFDIIGDRRDQLTKSDEVVEITGKNFCTYSDNIFDAVKTKKDILKSGGKVKASVVFIPLAEIQAHSQQWQPRHGGAGDKPDADLRKSIEEDGLLTPLVVDDRLNLLSGYHRHGVASNIERENKADLEVPVIVAEFDDDDTKRKYACISNNHPPSKSSRLADAEQELENHYQRNKQQLDAMNPEDKLLAGKRFVQERFGLTSATAMRVVKTVFSGAWDERGIIVVPAEQMKRIERKVWGEERQSNRKAAVQVDARGDTFVYARSSEISSVLGTTIRNILKHTDKVNINLSSQILVQEKLLKHDDIDKKRKAVLNDCTLWNSQLSLEGSQTGVIKSVLLFGQKKGIDEDQHAYYTWSEEDSVFEPTATFVTPKK